MLLLLSTEVRFDLEKPLVDANTGSLAGVETVRNLHYLFLFSIWSSLIMWPQTVTVMKTFVLAMVRHPEVYQKLQYEIDQVVGNERLPKLEDRKALPYVECVIKETYR